MRTKKATIPALVLIALMANALMSCSSRSIKPSETSAAAQITTQRLLAAADEEDFEVTFQKLLADPDPVAAVADHLKRQIAIYYRASNYVREFDQELNQATDSFDLERSPSFRKLQTLRAVSEHSRERLAFIYRRLLETRVEPGNSKERNALLRKMLSQYNKSLKTTDKLEALALQDLRQELIEIAAEIGKKYKSRKKPEPGTTVSPYFKNERDYFRAVKQTEDELELRSRNEAESGIDYSIHEELRQEEESVHQLLWPASEADRGPQSLRYEPGTGSGGNMNGGTFPAHTWALTYDDGPSGKHTPTILRNLQNSGKKATFFWLAQNVKAYQDVVKKVQDAGMTVSNHSFTHANLPKLGATGLNHEIAESTEVEGKIYGSKPKFFRCPYGAGVNVSRIRQLIADQGMIHVFWNVDSLDWQDKNPESILARVKKQMSLQKGGVVLFHDIHAQSVHASRMLLEWSATLNGTPQEIQWVTLPEITKKLNGETH